jgi:hypothetical protein
MQGVIETLFAERLKEFSLSSWEEQIKVDL